MVRERGRRGGHPINVEFDHRVGRLQHDIASEVITGSFPEDLDRVAFTTTSPTNT